MLAIEVSLRHVALWADGKVLVTLTRTEWMVLMHCPDAIMYVPLASDDDVRVRDADRKRP